MRRYRLHGRRFVSSLLALLLASPGCASIGATRPAEDTVAPPQELLDYYSYPGAVPEGEIELIEEKPAYTVYLVRFPLLHEGFEPTEPEVEFEWYRSKQPGRRPAILVNPILGGDYPIERAFCRTFARHGFHVAMPHRKTIKIGPDQDVDRIELMLRQGILRARQVVEWMASSDAVDPERIGSFGISMGAIATVILAAVEPRIKTHMAVLAGGGLPEVLLSSEDPMIKKPRRRYLRENDLTREELEALLREHLRTDPLLMAPYADASRFLMVFALLDLTIKPSNSFRLWRAMGFPRARFLPTGHYTSLLALPYIKTVGLNYFRKKL